jgi:RNA polymerase sigma factor (sigma-70 family)
VSADSQKLASIYLNCRRAMAKAVGRIVRRPDVEDILQEAFVRSYEAGHHNEIRDPRAFLMRTATNLAINHISRKEFQTTGTIEDLAPDALPESNNAPPEAQVDADRKFLAFCRAVSALPEQCQRAFILKKVYGLSQQEISSKLGIAESTVEKHIAKGLLFCRERLQADGAMALLRSRYPSHRA